MTTREIDLWDPLRTLDNLELAYRRAGDDNVKFINASGWYSRERRWIRDMAARYGVEAPRLAGIVAVLSPQTSWSSQKKHMAGVIKALMVGASAEELVHPGFLVNKAKAWRIFNCLGPNWGVNINGPKVKAFAKCLDPEAGSGFLHVVIDMHMVDAALGFISVEQREDAGSLTIKRYKQLSSQVALIANTVLSPSGHLKPHEAQAAIWEYQRTEVRLLD